MHARRKRSAAPGSGPRAGDVLSAIGFDQARLEGAFETLRREVKMLQIKLRVLEAAADGQAAAGADVALRAERVLGRGTDAERAGELDAREQALRQSEQAVNAVEIELTNQRALFAQERAELEAEVEWLESERTAFARQANELEDRTVALRRYDMELDVRERDLQNRARQLESAEAALADARRQVEVVHPVERILDLPAPVGAPEQPASSASTWKIDALAQLVEEQGRAFPERVDEWRYTLLYLRNEAYADGTLPGAFDWLVEDTFRELLASR
ncbi:MAG TPA: hypothetical protein VEH52_03910 [Gaiellaceae bacterium]|nr:hypothetical protein [Gaiellaceae bacterium]